MKEDRDLLGGCIDVGCNLAGFALLLAVLGAVLFGVVKLVKWIWYF